MSEPNVKAAKLQVDVCKGDMRPCGFKDWSYNTCYEFMQTWDKFEKNGYPEQASLALTCEAWGISYMDTEWMKIIEAIAERTA